MMVVAISRRQSQTKENSQLFVLISRDYREKCTVYMYLNKHGSQKSEGKVDLGICVFRKQNRYEIEIYEHFFFRKST